MKTYLLFYIENQAKIRQKNPLPVLNGLLSAKAYEEHERLYYESAVNLFNPVFGKTEYFEPELDFVWQFRETEFVEWIDCGEPAFIDTKPNQYRQIAKVKQEGANTYQNKVTNWLTACFGAQEAANSIERNFRFLEESLELVQCLGMTIQEVQRLVVYVFNREAGEPAEEIGDVMLTLAALSHANGLNMIESGENAVYRNWQNIDKIRAKQDSRVKAEPQTINY